MGTNYYRIPTEEEMNRRKNILQKRIDEIVMSPANIERRMEVIPTGHFDNISAWNEFISGTSIHLGKRSSGWTFLWNWNEGSYYNSKDELFRFIREGRVVNEYGEEWDIEEFIKMALSWGQPDGMDLKDYCNKYPSRIGANEVSKYEKYIEGLRVSTYVDFS